MERRRSLLLWASDAMLAEWYRVLTGAAGHGGVNGNRIIGLRPLQTSFNR